MKQLLFGAIVLFGLAKNSSAQKDVWTLGNNMVKFNGTGVSSITSLPQFNYTVAPDGNSVAGWNVDFSSKAVSNCYNDVNGNLLFYIADAKVYDKDGRFINYLIQPNMMIDQVVYGSLEFAIVPHKCNPNIFYILGTQRFYKSIHKLENPAVYYTKLELGNNINSTQANGAINNTSDWFYGDPLADGRLGFSNSDFTFPLQTLNTDLTFSPPMNVLYTVGANVGLLSSPMFSTAISKQQVDGNRLICISSTSTTAIFSSNSLESNALTGTSPTPLYSIGLNSVANDVDSHEEEMIQLANGQIRILTSQIMAGSLFTYQDFTYNPQTSTTPASLVLNTSTNVLSLAQALQITALGGNCHFDGVEFDPTGRYLYFMASGTNNYLYYLDLNQSSPAPVPVISNTATCNTILSTYKSSQIEIGKDGALYMLNGSKLAKISGVSNPTSIIAPSYNFSSVNLTNVVSMTDVYRIKPYSVIVSAQANYTLNDQVDGETIANVNEVLNPIFTSNKVNYCQGDIVTLNGSTSFGTLNGSLLPNAITYYTWIVAPCDVNGNLTGPEVWSWGTGTPGTYTLSTAAGSNPMGICNKYYKLKLAVVGECVPWAEQSKIVYVSCKPLVSYDGNTTVCSGSAVNLCAAAPSGTTVQWYIPGFRSAKTTSCISFIPNGSGIVTLIFTNQYGCSTSVSIPITVIANKPDFTLTGTHAPNALYYTASATPSYTTTVSGFQEQYIIEEVVQTSINPLTYSVVPNTTTVLGTNPDPACWHVYPGTVSFKGFTGSMNVATGICSIMANGLFPINKIYRVTRKTKNDYCDWKSFIQYLNTPPNGRYAFGYTNPKDVVNEIDNDNLILSNKDENVSSRVLNISLFPNPTSGLVKIDSEEKIQSIHITTITGALVKDVENENEVDLLTYPAGMYFFTITTENSKKTIKVIKE